MIRLRPLTTEQTFSIIPSSYEIDDILNCTIYITNDETDQVYSYIATGDLIFSIAEYTWEDANLDWDSSSGEEGWVFTLSENTNYINIKLLSPEGLIEGSVYKFEMKSDSLLLFRDTIFVSNETDKAKTYTYPDTYDQYDDGSDTYIVL